MSSSVDRDRAALLRIDWTTGEKRVVASRDKADVGWGIFAPKTNELTAASAEYARREWIALDPPPWRDCRKCEHRGSGNDADGPALTYLPRVASTPHRTRRKGRVRAKLEAIQSIMPSTGALTLRADTEQEPMPVASDG